MSDAPPLLNVEPLTPVLVTNPVTAVVETWTHAQAVKFHRELGLVLARMMRRRDHE